MQNLKRNWLVISKLTWRQHLKVPKIFILMCSFWAKYILFELKKYRGVIFHETEEEYKFWNWHKEFGKFWPEHSKISKIFTLMGFFRAKYILFKLKKYKGIIFHETKEGYKIWRGIQLSFQDWHKEFDKFWLEPSEVSKIFTLIGSFWGKYTFFELKKYRGVTFHETEEGYKIWRGFNSSILVVSKLV